MKDKALKKAPKGLTLVLVVSVAFIGLAAVVPVQGQEPLTPVPTVEAAPVASNPAAPRVLKDATEALREGRHADAAKLLKGLPVQSLAPNDARRWRAMASLAALRTGDRTWADEINNDPEKFGNTMNLITATAARMLQEGQYDKARALLGQIKNPEGLDEIPRRRYLQLFARLEQMTGHPDQERVYIEKLVDFAGQWASPTCQACHGNVKQHGEAVVSLDVSRWWVGERMTALLGQKSDAERERKAAETRLKNNPGDAGARLRLAYALRAENKAGEAETVLRALPWADFPDRERKTPLRFATFP